jgi:hypothetical protein
MKPEDITRASNEDLVQELIDQAKSHEKGDHDAEYHDISSGWQMATKAEEMVEAIRSELLRRLGS